jgi:radical SAM superfamily enzyme YgiQ (UPF0313 family)
VERALTNVLLIAPRFPGRSFWSLDAAAEVYGARVVAAPLGLLTVAAMLPPAWTCRLVDRSLDEVKTADLDWADLVMTGGMLPQRPDTLAVVALAQAHGKPVVVGGPDTTSSPEIYADADFRVLGEAEGVIDDFIAAWDAGARSGVFEAPKFKIDVTKTPIPRYDLINRRDYVVFGVQFARGCPFNCEFCDIIELFGRVPRVKTPEQMLAELDALYRTGYRGPLDFVDDNFIGNKKAVKAFLPHLIAWQKGHGYPFLLLTEASINLADDDALLQLMREANFFAVFVGIESPDTDTLIATQKKQNTRRALEQSIHKIYRAGMIVHAGFIFGFDAETANAQRSMIDCIAATSIPICMIGLLYALPGTQLTTRLTREKRLFAANYWGEQRAKVGGVDQCAIGLNFLTKRPRREILNDYRAVLEEVYEPSAFFRRLGNVARMIDRPILDRSGRIDPPAPTLFGVDREELRMLWRILARLATRMPTALWPFLRLLYACLKTNPRAAISVGMATAFYLHVGPFSRYVMSFLDGQIAEIDSGVWREPLPEAAPPDALPVLAAPGRAPRKVLAR